MSAQDIIAELTKLKREDLELVKSRLHDLLQDTPPPTDRSWGAALLEVAGAAQGLPRDFAGNHDHYLHGAPKR